MPQILIMKKIILYLRQNIFTEDDCEDFIICHQTHLVKTGHNNLAHYCFDNLLLNDNY